MIKSLFFYIVAPLLVAIVFHMLPTVAIDSLALDLVNTSVESGIDDRIKSIFQYQIWSGALLAASAAFVLRTNVAKSVVTYPLIFAVLFCSSLSFATGYVHFEILHYFKETGYYISEVESGLRFLPALQSTLLMWSVFMFAQMVRLEAHAGFAS